MFGVFRVWFGLVFSAEKERDGEREAVEWKGTGERERERENTRRTATRGCRNERERATRDRAAGRIQARPHGRQESGGEGSRGGREEEDGREGGRREGVVTVFRQHDLEIGRVSASSSCRLRYLPSFAGTLSLSSIPLEASSKTPSTHRQARFDPYLRLRSPPYTHRIIAYAPTMSEIPKIRTTKIRNG